MTIRSIFLGAVLAASVAAPAIANPLQPIEARSIDLGGLAGVAYFTPAPEGFHMVATLSPREASGAPVRFEAMLRPGQSLTMSTPRGVDQAADAVVISRRGDAVFVRREEPGAAMR